LRDDPVSYSDDYFTNRIARNVIKNEFKDSYPAYKWSNALYNAAAKLVNDHGSCEIPGEVATDANGDNLEELIKKYYVYDIGEIEVLNITVNGMDDYRPDQIIQLALA